jgi:hypothetical protein
MNNPSQITFFQGNVPTSFAVTSSSDITPSEPSFTVPGSPQTIGQPYTPSLTFKASNVTDMNAYLSVDESSPDEDGEYVEPIIQISP